MASLDSIFQKSDLEESKRKAKMLFGKVLINLRKNNHIKLYAMLESVNETDLIDDVLKLTLSDKTAYEMINNKADIETLCITASSIQSNAKVEIICNGKDAFDMYKFESKLRQEFGISLPQIW